MGSAWPQAVKKLFLRESTRINPCANFLGGGAAGLVSELIWVARLRWGCMGNGRREGH